ncbi:MAG: flagellar basal body L-ring protein FlgH [Deltaproteobacteria bacterium]|nr:flagellar basal body L-ring protein FlgH [Deltaproteobacteria bacterium]
MKNAKIIGRVLLALSLLPLGACNGLFSQAKQAPAPIYSPVETEVAQQPAGPVQTYHHGSICPVADGREVPVMLYDARRAHRVGDIVYIIIAENFKGSGNASTVSDGSNEASYGIPELFGYKNVFGSKADMAKLIEAKRSNKTEGKGATSRSNTLTARLAVRVMEVMPNGNLKIRGSHFTQVNGENHYVTLTGIIRASDIAPDNTVSSSLIADAAIDYGGTGTLGSKQRLGWATKILDLVWPF